MSERKDTIRYDDLYLERPNAVAFDCIECSESVYINPKEPTPRCVACSTVYDIDLKIEKQDEVMMEAQK